MSTGSFGLALGSSSTAGAVDAITIGRGNSVTGDSSVAIGDGLTVPNANTIQIGGQNHNLYVGGLGDTSRIARGHQRGTFTLNTASIDTGSPGSSAATMNDSVFTYEVIGDSVQIRGMLDFPTVETNNYAVGSRMLFDLPTAIRPFFTGVSNVKPGGEAFAYRGQSNFSSAGSDFVTGTALILNNRIGFFINNVVGSVQYGETPLHLNINFTNYVNS